jgi:hypothetical protein
MASEQYDPAASPVHFMQHAESALPGYDEYVCLECGRRLRVRNFPTVERQELIPGDRHAGHWHDCYYELPAALQAPEPEPDLSLWEEALRDLDFDVLLGY